MILKFDHKERAILWGLAHKETALLEGKLLGLQGAVGGGMASLQKDWKQRLKEVKALRRKLDV